MSIKILFSWLVIFFIAQPSIAQTQQEMAEKAQKAAKEAAGQIQIESPGANFKAEEEYEKYGIEEMGSSGSLLSSSATLSANLSANKYFTCRDGVMVYLSYLRVKFTRCDIRNSNFDIEYCSSIDGRECSAINLKQASLTQNVKHGFNTSDSIELNECGNNKCKLTVVHTPEDNLSGDLESEAEARDAANPSAATRAALDNLNNPLYDEFKGEADDTADYATRAFEQVETDGEMPIYRNSPSDIGLYGNRDGILAIDAEAMAGGEICTQDSQISTQTCQNNFSVAEFVCDQSPPVCSYERVESVVQDCGRKLTMTCDKTANCTSIDYFDYSGTNLPANYSTQNSLVLAGKRYQIQGNAATFPIPQNAAQDKYYLRFLDEGNDQFTVKSGTRFSYDDNPYRRYFSFDLQIKDISKLQSFIFVDTQHEDFMTMLVNDVPVYTFPTVKGIKSSCYPFRDLKKGKSGKFGARIIATCKNGKNAKGTTGTYEDRSESIRTVNMNIKPYLRSGKNTIKIILLVKGRGHIDLTFRPHYTKVCSCAWTETWEQSSCNT